MRTIRFLLQKEFRQIFRNKTLAAMMLVVPLVQLLILPLAANYEVKNISLAVLDYDHSSYSQKLISKTTASGYFKLVDYTNSYDEAYNLVSTDKADLILTIPPGFERNLVREGNEKLALEINAINGVKAGLGGAYLSQIIRQFDEGLRTESMPRPKYNSFPAIEIVSANWYNRFLSYDLFMVPGILAVLVTMIGGYMSALNIVKEKEIGTIEQINVTPIRKHHFIIGKLIPFWILGMVVFSLGLFIVARLVYGIIPVGNILVLYAFLAIYLVAILGFGLLISTYSNTQQQAMTVAFFFVMIFMLMSGLFTSIDSMPEWAKTIARLNPVTYMIDVMRMVVLKGSGFRDIRFHILFITLFALVLNTWAVLNYRKTSS
jgi:ABC-2 type transport system permease protein